MYNATLSSPASFSGSNTFKMPTFDANWTTGWWILPVVAGGALAWAKIFTLVF